MSKYMLIQFEMEYDYNHVLDVLREADEEEEFQGVFSVREIEEKYLGDKI